MAFVPLIPGSLNPSCTQGAKQAFSTAPILNPAGTPVDFSAWSAMSAKLVPASPNPTGADVTFGTVAGTNAGVVTLTQSATDLATIPPGTAKLVITGIPVALDPSQLVATGVLTLNAG